MSWWKEGVYCPFMGKKEREKRSKLSCLVVSRRLFLCLGKDGFLHNGVQRIGWKETRCGERLNTPLRLASRIPFCNSISYFVRLAIENEQLINLHISPSLLLQQQESFARFVRRLIGYSKSRFQCPEGIVHLLSCVSSLGYLDKGKNKLTLE